MSDKHCEPLKELPERRLTQDQAQVFAAEVVDQWRAPPKYANRRGAAVALLAAVLLGAIGLAYWDRPSAHPLGLEMTTVSPQTPALADDRVTASAGAVFQVEGERAHRVLRLTEGSVFCVIDKRAPGEVFQVIVGDALVEVTGTRFGVLALDGDLDAVWVEEGSVALTLPSGEHLVLASGDSWPSDEVELPTADLPFTEPALQQASEPPPLPLSPTIEVPQTPNKPRASEALTGVALARGLKLLDQGRFTQAAAVLDEEPDGVLRQDALFWRAVALNRGGQLSAAAVAFETFLAMAPDSSRAGSAHCMLGRLLVNDPQAAEPHFQAAKRSQDPRAAQCRAQD
ncbi:MAG: hypothetical protein ACI9VR_004177 [Cognaticolwellia sp.]|jgi:hypothetical protein